MVEPPTIAGTLTTQYAAVLFGLAEWAHSQINYAIGGPMRTLADAALATVQAALEPAVFTDAFAAGQQMTLAEAFASIRQDVYGSWTQKS